jgi:cell division septum initiation protein DivIVA
VDVATVDREYQQLQQESQELTQAIQGLASKLQAAVTAGDESAKEWIPDLKGIALQIQQEQLQVQALLQALHGFAVNTLQQAPSPQPVGPAPAQPAPSQSGGMLSHFLSGGFGQVMTAGVGLGAGFGLADSVINSLFD